MLIPPNIRHYIFSIPGTREYSVLSAPGILGTRECSVVRGFDTPGTRDNAVIPAFGIPGAQPIARNKSNTGSSVEIKLKTIQADIFGTSLPFLER